MLLYRSIQSVSNSKNKSWSTILPLLEEDKEFLPGLSPVERTTLSAYHREKKSLEEALGHSSSSSTSTALVKQTQEQKRAAQKAAAEARRQAKAQAAALLAAASGKPPK